MKNLQTTQLENLHGGNCTGQAISEAGALITMGKVANNSESTGWDWASASAGVTGASYAWFKCMGWL